MILILNTDWIIKMDKNKLFNLIKLSLWGKKTIAVDWETYEEMKRQAIVCLPAEYLSSLQLPSELLKEWKKQILQQITIYTQYSFEQMNLQISVPYVVLKGSSATMYYPHPEYRIIGDIDIMTRREDFDTAYQQLIDNGYSVINALNRETTFVKNGITVELHRRFATLNDPAKAKYLDDLIIENITPSHVLPDLINGLVILEHISQHMEGGLGLRQIIDWMMFVDKCLPDERWPAFREQVQKIGLEKLAITTTRMCEIYLGLPQRDWCKEADTTLCGQLMDYVLLCGNFGNKKNSDTDISENAFAYASTPRAAFKLLQKQGLKNWRAAKGHKILQPFAWIYQAFRYAFRGLKREHAFARIREEYSAGKKRKEMFDALGVKTVAKGDVVFRDGKYIKE